MRADRLDEPLYLTAQWELRTLTGAGEGGLLFPTRGGKPMSASAMVQVINDAHRELGVAVAPARIDRNGTSGDPVAHPVGASASRN